MLCKCKIKYLSDYIEFYHYRPNSNAYMMENFQNEIIFYKRCDQLGGFYG